MTSDTTTTLPAQPENEKSHHLFDDWFDPVEEQLRGRARAFIEELLHGELETALGRGATSAGRSRMAGENGRWPAIATGAGHGR